MRRQWQRVVFADDCPPCEMCGEPRCWVCDEHYSDCMCPGPTQDGYEYSEKNGVLYARELEDDE